VALRLELVLYTTIMHRFNVKYLLRVIVYAYTTDDT